MKITVKYLLILPVLCLVNLLHAQNINEETFKNPPKQYKPKTWMHAMSGNMSKEGLTKDLEAMKEAGLGGFLLFNITQGIPNGAIIYNSPEHHNMLTHTAQEAERLGLSFGVHNCDGWSSSGGPWVTPEQSMKMVVWSEQILRGGKNVRQILPQPTKREGFYRDIAVLAYPSLPTDITDFEAKPTVITSDSKAKLDIINDLKWDAETPIKQEGKAETWVQFDYGKPHTIRSVFLIHKDRNTNYSLAYSDDGVTFKTHTKLKKIRTGKDEWANNVSFEPVTARYFRILGDATMTVREMSLRGTQLMDNTLGRISMSRTEDENLEPVGKPDASMLIDKSKILDLTKYFDPQTATLNADLPEGNWTILRFGYTSTSAYNHPASKEGKGLEVDKLSRPFFKNHYDVFVKKVVENSKKVSPNALQYVEIDSYEMGGQNWTEGIDALFLKEYGYDFKAFLPLITGRFVESMDASEAILEDYRELICNLMTNNYFGYFQELCHKDGLKTYIEPYGFGPINNLEVGSKADIPMGEFWMYRNLTQVNSAIQSAHIYGKPVISAESFTSESQLNWKMHPALAKVWGDKAWAVGINEFMFHRFAHQSNPNVLPGMTMNRWGSHIDRTQTWWLNAGAAWFKYLSRGAYLLQSGVPVSDLLVFVGDGSPNGVVGRNAFQPNIPKGTNFDCVNADVLINRIKVENGELVLPEGTRYKALVLSSSDKMKLSTVKRLQKLTQQGVLIIGQKPEILRGYKNTPNQLAEFEKMVTDIWSKPTTVKHFNWAEIFKKHNIQSDCKIETVSDVNFMHRKVGDTDIYFIHNPDTVSRTFNVQFRIKGKVPELWQPMDASVQKLANFVEKDNFTEGSISLEAEGSVFVVFKEIAKNIVSIKSENTPTKLSFNLNKNNQIEAQISQNGTYKAELSDGKTWDFTVKNLPEAQILRGSWQVQFKKVLDYGGTFTFDKLTDWKDHANDTIKHYAGTATYTQTFDFNKKLMGNNTHVTLDLGKVSIAAEVILNGKNLGIFWKAPFTLDVTDAVQNGKNTLEIQVTNLWTNRLIGDERYPPNDKYNLDTLGNGNFTTKIMPDWYIQNQPRPSGERKTFTTANFYKATDPLISSGLLGDVVLRFSRILVKN
jgi:alpha-L-rhamnosidase/F5/8 type C domain/Glycosyl hydrolases family 2, sugar binding domain